jgi:hypothetical protein
MALVCCPFVKNIEYHRLGFLWSSRVWKTQANAMQKISTTNDKASAGDPIPPKGTVIEAPVAELKQLFDAIDPSPFRDRDLDPKAEQFIVG